MVVITLVGFLYQQALVQQALTKNLIKHTAIYSECNSLIPILRSQLHQENLEELKKPELSFFSVYNNEELRWTVDRSAWENQKIQFTFLLTEAQSAMDPIKLTIKYQKP